MKKKEFMVYQVINWMFTITIGFILGSFSMHYTMLRSMVPFLDADKHINLPEFAAVWRAVLFRPEPSMIGVYAAILILVISTIVINIAIGKKYRRLLNSLEK
ncbi:MAG: hypothetical protein WCJ71_03320 [Candidatus Omnitrophota bacterium]